MYRRFAALALLAIVACKKGEEDATTNGQPRAMMPADSFMVVDSFRTPESVLYDSVMDVYVVSNINGAPLDKDDNGFLSRVGADGRVLELKWVDGASDSVTLNAPKGMGIHGDTLFVADIDVVRMFDRTTGQSLGALPVPGATFLNDIDVGADGTVYVTDSGLKADFTSNGSDAVYRRGTSGGFRALAHATTLGAPNGVSAGPGNVTVVSFASGAAYQLDLQGHRTDLPRPAAGQLDGVFHAAGGRLVASSWADSSVIALDSGATAWHTLYRGLPTPADIGYDSRRGRVLIPLFSQNRIEVRKIH